jgi:predicted nucleotide-binding protein (sugar kinase/HSP70/actin superfamily)
MTNTYYPIYKGFFTNLGMEVISSSDAVREGMETAGSAFCLPVLHSHGHVQDLLKRQVDRIFIPHVKGFPSGDEGSVNCTCPLVQGEPYILKAAFGRELSEKILTTILDFNKLSQVKESFVHLGKGLGYSRRRSAEAFEKAWSSYEQVRKESCLNVQKILDELGEKETALVLFGRPYNAFNSLANMGVPAKFASREYCIIPHDLLPVEGASGNRDGRMYWASGRTILDAAKVVRDTYNLFGVFITNFSCGPDSFIIERFRSIMGDKPFLILELDAHTADAGVDTRVEAFLDVVESYRRLKSARAPEPRFTPSRVIKDGSCLFVQASDGRRFSITDPQVHLLVPTMGDTVARYLTAAFRYVGVNATTAPKPGRDELTLGSQCASCKECLPYLLTSGSLRRYMRDRCNENEVLLYLMPEADGPCRFGLYGEALRSLIERVKLENVAVFSPSSRNGYQGLPAVFPRRALLAAAIADGLDDIRAGILTLAHNTGEAIRTLSEVEETIWESLASNPENEVDKVLRENMLRISLLRKSGTMRDVTKVLLTGEIYVRRDGFSSCDLVRRLAEEGILVKTSPVLEWLFYVDHIVITGILDQATPSERLALWFRNRYSRRVVSRIQEILELSGFFQKQHLDIGFLLDRGQRLIDPRLTGEAILTVSSTLAEIGDDVHGVISISPFGCMPGRIAEAVINHRLVKDKPLFSRKNGQFWKRSNGRYSLPFLAMETDGSSLSQMAETKLESFIRSAHRLNRELKEDETFEV